MRLNGSVDLVAKGVVAAGAMVSVTGGRPVR
jgi:hypothetical protein